MAIIPGLHHRAVDDDSFTTKQHTVHGNATFSPCKTWRYRLDYTWGTSDRRVSWILLNPSTADGSAFDPTLNRCYGFTCRSRHAAAGGMTILNSHGLRATDRRFLRSTPDPIGPENDLIVEAACAAAALRGDVVIAGWGTDVNVRDHQRSERLLALARQCGLQLFALALTKHGQPQHPLYRPGVPDGSYLEDVLIPIPYSR